MNDGRGENSPVREVFFAGWILVVGRIHREPWNERFDFSAWFCDCVYAFPFPTPSLAFFWRLSLDLSHLQLRTSVFIVHFCIFPFLQSLGHVISIAARLLGRAFPNFHEYFWCGAILSGSFGPRSALEPTECLVPSLFFSCFSYFRPLFHSHFFASIFRFSWSTFWNLKGMESSREMREREKKRGTKREELQFWKFCDFTFSCNISDV